MSDDPTVRELLAAAASTVEGVNVVAKFRQSTKVGDGMVRRDRTDYPDRFGGVNTWQVIVTLPQSLAAAEAKRDEWQSALYAALQPEMTVRSIVPQQLVVDAGKVPVLVITGTREEE